jgi:hypothetical protein
MKAVADGVLCLLGRRENRERQRKERKREEDEEYFPYCAEVNWTEVNLVSAFPQKDRKFDRIGIISR